MEHRLYAKRGSALKVSKLTNDDILQIRELVKIREEHYKNARELSAKKPAEKFDVHYRTIEKITQYETWVHVK